MNFPDDLKYTHDHEWVKIESGVGTIGITDYAQSELGDIIYIDITAGDSVKQGESFGTIEAVKTVSEMYSPISGKVKEINSKINDNPASVNQDPYGEGWIIKVEIENQDETDKLMDSASYKQQVGG